MNTPPPPPSPPVAPEGTASCGSEIDWAYQWDVRSVDLTFSLPVSQRENQANTLTLYIPPWSLPAGKAYVARLTACVVATGASRLCVEASAAFFLGETALAPQVRGGECTVGEGSVIRLDASGSRDPDVSHGDQGLEFSWECNDVRGDPCRAPDDMPLNAGKGDASDGRKTRGHLLSAAPTGDSWFALNP